MTPWRDLLNIYSNDFVIAWRTSWESFA